MANPPGVVTDPSRIKGGVVSLQSGGIQIAGLCRDPEPARQLSRHRRDPGGVRPGRSHLRPGPALRQYRLQCLRAGAVLAARRPDQPGRHGHVFPVMFGLPDSEAVQDLEAAADYLRALPGATGKIGAIGFCSGGRHTLLFACSSSKVDAAIDCWGGFIDRANPNEETNAARPKAAARHGRPAAIARCSACSAPRTRTRRSRSKPS